MAGVKRIVPGVKRPSARQKGRAKYEMAQQFEQMEDLPVAEIFYRQADQLGHAQAATRLGLLLEEQDDTAGAEAAYRRADARGDADGAFALAWLLAGRGDVSGADEAYRRADRRGHPAAAGNRAMLVHDERGRSGRRRAGAPPRSRRRRGIGALASVGLAAAFAAAFALGAQGGHAHRQPHLASVTSVHQPTVTIAPVAPVAKPPKIRLQHRRKARPKSKPASTADRHGVHCRCADLYRPRADLHRSCPDIHRPGAVLHLIHAHGYLAGGQRARASGGSRGSSSSSSPGTGTVSGGG